MAHLQESTVNCSDEAAADSLESFLDDNRRVDSHSRDGLALTFSASSGDFMEVHAAAMALSRGEEVEEEDVDLDSMTAKQLKAFAVDNDIDLDGVRSKADILAAIQNALNGEGEGEGEEGEGDEE